MTVQEYTDACLKFAAASRGWSAVDESQFITTHDGSWEMTADNQNGGLDIAWAFHREEEEICAEAPQRFMDYVRQELDLAADSGPEMGEIVATVRDLLTPGIYSLAEVK
ncbi:MAG: hypothetical protein ACTTH3_00165 [Schwartzia sp. (in: firmicutes)]